MATGNHNGQTYIHGNTVRKYNDEPLRRPREQRKKRQSYQVRKNRERAVQMSAGYILVLIVSAAVTVGLCIWYINVKEENTKVSESVTALQQQIASEKEANNTIYNSAADSVNLTELRKKAIEMGMQDVGKDQVVKYSGSSKDSVKQYEKIPKSGTLAESEKARD